MMKYREKPVVIDAWLNTDDGEPIPDWMNEAACWLTGGRFALETRGGTVIVEPGDWIIRGIDADTFEATYWCKNGDHGEYS